MSAPPIVLNIILVILIVCGILFLYVKKHIYLNWKYNFVLLLCVIIMPCVFYIGNFFSTSLSYHWIMRMPWVFVYIFPIVLFERYFKSKLKKIHLEHFLCFLLGIIIFNFFLLDNIGYIQLQQRYEKSYAMCIRMVDRIEQLEGYNQNTKVAIMGTVQEENTRIVNDIFNKVHMEILFFLIRIPYRIREDCIGGLYNII